MKVTIKGRHCPAPQRYGARPADGRSRTYGFSDGSNPRELTGRETPAAEFGGSPPVRGGGIGLTGGRAMSSPIIRLWRGVSMM